MAMPLQSPQRRTVKEAERLAARAQFLTFTLGGETFGLEIRHIREILQFEGLTEVPLMPDFVRGVINLRGAVVPVIDLHVRFGKAPTEATRRTCIVIIEAGHQGALVVLGIMVDHVSEVLEIAPSDIEPRPSFGTDSRAECIKGVGKVQGTFVILLDIAHVLSLDEMTAVLGSHEDSDQPG